MQKTLLQPVLAWLQLDGTFQQVSHLRGFGVTLQPQPASYAVMFPVSSLINREQLKTNLAKFYSR